MKKKILLGLGLIILVVGAWMIFDYYHYFPPGIAQPEIRQQAEAILKQEAPSLIRNNMDPNTRKEFRRLDILAVEELKGKTYLVFKMDYEWVGPAEALPYGFNSGGYILGLRRVEQKLGGISLQDGMEFESSYQGAGPVDCGQDEDGVFYGFCKDPRVSRASLETQSGENISLQIKQRVILAQLTPNMEFYPHFYSGDKLDSEGEGASAVPAGHDNEIELSYGMRIAFISKDEKTYQQYTNTPMEWWALKAKDSSYLRANDVDAIWVFPDQQQEALQGEVGTNLRALALEGIPVLFIGLKESNVLTPVFQLKSEPAQEVAKDDIEALYVGKDANGSLQLGTISVEDEAVFPIMQKSISLRYQLLDYKVAQSQSSNGITNKSGTAKAIPVPSSSVVRGSSTGTASGSGSTKGVTK